MSENSFRQAKKELSLRHDNALSLQKQHKEEISRRIPEARSLIRTLDGTGFRIAQTVFAGGNVAAAIRELMVETEEIRSRLLRLLTDNGFREDYLEVRYSCSLCGDTGYVNGRKCRCLRELNAKYSAQEFNETSCIARESFDSFSLHYYPDNSDGTGRTPRQVMRDILEFCRIYAERFSIHAPSVLMMGETGLGKTHLSLSIADEVMKRGFSVIYASAPDLFRKLQNEYYTRREPGDADTMDVLQKTNLVILDDLGAEMENQFNVSALYNIVNTRLNAGYPTIISTNLFPRELERRYSSRIASRLMTMYKCLKFSGRDVRQLKLQKGR